MLKAVFKTPSFSVLSISSWLASCGWKQLSLSAKEIPNISQGRIRSHPSKLKGGQLEIIRHQNELELWGLKHPGKEQLGDEAGGKVQRILGTTRAGGVRRGKGHGRLQS